VFQFFDHTGDIGIDVDAPDPGSVFADAACAFAETITDREALPGEDAREISLAGEGLDLLLVDWLSELLYHFETNRWLPREVEATISGAEGRWALEARLSGGRLDPDRHEVRVSVKAVTYHALAVLKTGDRWHARVILDI
jgi:SHS2 domain-containing protein